MYGIYWNIISHNIVSYAKTDWCWYDLFGHNNSPVIVSIKSAGKPMHGNVSFMALSWVIIEQYQTYRTWKVAAQSKLLLMIMLNGYFLSLKKPMVYNIKNVCFFKLVHIPFPPHYGQMHNICQWTYFLITQILIYNHTQANHIIIWEKN